MITRLLVWALAIVAIDVVVIATNDDASASSTRAAQAAATTTSSSTATTATTTTSTTATTTTTTTISTTTTAPAAEQATSTTLAPADATATTVATAPPTTAPGTDPGATCVSTPAAGEVAHLHCDGETASSATFQVTGKWIVRWQVEPGTGVAGNVLYDDGQSFFVPMKSGAGESGFVGGCTCTLQLVPDGSAYDVVVVDVDG
jgi:hypothetical protein